MKYTVLTYGCQMNTSDSERIHTMLDKSGFEFEPEMEKADLIIMNTCSVKQKAEDKVWGHFWKIKHMKRANKQVRVGLTGCMVRDSGVAPRYVSDLASEDDLFKSSKLLDFVFRIEDLPKVSTYLSVLYDENIGQDYSDDLTSYFGVRPQYTKSFQVFVPVQTGCNKFCTYCIVPFTRKREISRPMQEILDEVKLLVDQGAKEVTLLGQTVNSYTHESSTNEYSENNFAELLYQINKLPTLDRIRYTSPHPMDMDDELIRAHVELEKMCNNVHLPVQSGDNEILRKMNRKYTREQYLEIILKVKAAIPDVTITTDIIVGFPGETEEQFQQTCSLFDEVGFDMSFTSRYSPRKGTYSDRKMEDTVSVEEKARRWHHLNKVMIDIIREKNLAYKDKIFPVLIEKKLPDGRWEGMTRSNKRVQFSSKRVLSPGEIVPVKIARTQEFFLTGESLI